MHKRYGFELQTNEPDLKTFVVKSNNNPDSDCWVSLSHDFEDLEMGFNVVTEIKEQFKPVGLFNRIKNKFRVC